MSRKTRREYWDENSAIWQLLSSILCGRFVWENLPERLTSDQLERFITLWSGNGLAVGFSDRTGGPMILPGYPSGEFDIYWLPRSYTVTGALYDRVIDSDSCVPFWDNPSRRSLVPITIETATALTECWTIMATNTRQQRNPYVFSGTKTQIETLKEAARKRAEGDEILAVTDDGMNTIETAKRFFPIKPEFLGPLMMEHYTQIINRFLTAVGIDNVPILKRERVSTAESAANNQLILYNRGAATRMRETAAEAFNKMFGTNLDVKWKGGEMNNEIRAAIQPGQSDL